MGDSPSDMPSGPSAEEEAALLAGEMEQSHAAPVDRTAGGSAEEESGNLPPMEDLVQRIPAATRELLEEKFRARFVTVKRVPRTALQP